MGPSAYLSYFTVARCGYSSNPIAMTSVKVTEIKILDSSLCK